MISYSEMWLQTKDNTYTRQYWKYTVEATYIWNNQWRYKFIDSDWWRMNHLVTLSQDCDAEQMDIALLQCVDEMALEEYDEYKFDYILEPHDAFDSETVWIISIVLLLASMVFGVLWIFVYAFVRMCIFTFISWIVVWIYAMSIKYKAYK